MCDLEMCAGLRIAHQIHNTQFGYSWNDRRKRKKWHRNTLTRVSERVYARRINDMVYFYLSIFIDCGEWLWMGRCVRARWWPTCRKLRRLRNFEHWPKTVRICLLFFALQSAYFPVRITINEMLAQAKALNVVANRFFYLFSFQNSELQNMRNRTSAKNMIANYGAETRATKICTRTALEFQSEIHIHTALMTIKRPSVIIAVCHSSEINAC